MSHQRLVRDSRTGNRIWETVRVTANHVAPYVRHAWEIYEAEQEASRDRQVQRANRVEDQLTRRETMAPVARRSKSYGPASGVFKGNFNSARKQQESVESKHQRHGYHVTDEQFGIVSDPDCCYLWHSTYHLDRLVRAIVGASVRELFHIGGIAINNSGTTLNLGFTTGATVSYRLRISRIDMITGVIVSPLTSDVGNNPSFTQILNNFTDYTNYLTDYFTNNSSLVPYQLQLLIADTHGVTSTLFDYRTVASMDLQSCKFKIDVHSSICIQNRTSGATATGAQLGETDRVDNQPLEGYMFQFRNADPRVKNPDTGLSSLNRMRNIGITLGTSVSLGQPLQEPMVPKLFQNCSKSVKIRLNPGELKEQNLYHTYSGNFEKISKQLRSSHIPVTVAPRTFLSGVQGKCQMFMLEEQIRSNAANVITINYERQVKIGATCTNVFKHVPLLTELTSGESNFP